MSINLLKRQLTKCSKKFLLSHSTGVQTILTGRSKSTENLTLKFLFDLSKNTVNFELKQNMSP